KLYGTDDTLYDTDTKKWITGSQGFKDSLEFLQTIYSEGLGPELDQALDVNIGSRVSTELLPEGKLAMAVDGSWLPGGWISGENAWPEWEETIG
ncbi:ABC superfamily ATP binding cassette transporter, solute-binding protein, partial [human gut metagenome]